MTGICGLIAKGDEDLDSKALEILSLMRTRGSKTQTFTQMLADGGKITLGFCDSIGVQLFGQSTTPIALDGIFFHDSHEQIKPEPAGPRRLIRTPGAFAFLTTHQEHLVAGRDLLGQKPLYYTRTKTGAVAFSSLSSPLSSIGAKKPEPVPPGKAIEASINGDLTITDFSLKRPREEEAAEDSAVERLADLFSEGVRRILPRRSGIAFSGGLDSGVFAKVARDEGLESVLITVGLKGQQELDHAKEIAHHLSLDVSVRELSETDVIACLPEVITTIETADPVIVGISVPIYFACEKAREMGLTYLGAGQLSDELFGGYGRFEDLARQGVDLEGAMFDSVVAASVNDFDPGDKLAVAHGLELCCPFAYLPFVEYALRLPASLRVKIVGDKVIRKYVLRKLAASLELPQSVADRPKKAVQYSSGVQRVLLREAKRKRVGLVQMLESFAA